MVYLTHHPATMSLLKALEVRRVTHSEELTNPGEFVFIQKREPIRTIERQPLEPPQGFLKRMYWKFFGKKYEVKEIIEIVWPEHDAVIINCPYCNSPCSTTKHHKLLSLDPLTIEIPITCPYCRTNSFQIREGKITMAQ